MRNTTEAINLVAYSWGNAQSARRRCDSADRARASLRSRALAAARGAHRRRLRFIPVDERGLYVLDDLDELLDGCKLVACAHVSNTLGTIAPLEIIVRARMPPAPSFSSTARKALRICRSTSRRSTSTSTRSAATRCSGRPESACSTAKRALLEAMPPFFSGGDMIRKVEYDRTTFNDPPRKFEAGTSNIADAIAFGVAVEYLEIVGMDWVREHERR